MRVQATDIDGVLLLEPTRYADERGWFREVFHLDRLREATGQAQLEFPQDNQSCSAAGVLRGLHFQRPPHAQAKLITVLRGEILDVVVDLRSGSPTRGAWRSFALRADSPQLWVPEGCAHGFLAREDGPEIHYKTTALYHAESEATLAWDDPDLGVDWDMGGRAPELSDQDRAGVTLDEACALVADAGAQAGGSARD